MSSRPSSVAHGPRTEEREAQAAASPATPPDAAVGSGWRPPALSSPTIVAIVLLTVAGMLAVLAAWRVWPFVPARQSTDNAYVRGRVTVIAPQVSGYVTQVLVRDFEAVRAGQPLVAIDSRIYAQRVGQALAQVAAQQATLANSRQAETAVDQARAAREIARQDIRTVEVGRGGQRAGVTGAAAALRLARIDLANTVVRAPEDGRLSEVGVRLGQYVTAGSQLMFLVPAEVWVIANYKEAQTARIAVGQPASFTVDALDGARVRGHVERISPAAGSEFAVIRSDNATGNFTKVPQRIAVRIRIDPGQPVAARLRPGMSVEARVDTRPPRR